MKITFVAASQVPANTANSIQVMKVCQAFARLGHQVDLLVPGDPHRASSLDPSLADHYGLATEFSIRWLASPGAWRRYDLAWKAVREARRLGADILYTWMLQTAFLGLSQGVPTLLEVHDRVTGKLGPTLFRRFLRSKTRKRLLPITLALKRALEQEFKVTFPAQEVVVSPDGVDLERYKDLPGPADSRQQLGLDERLTAVYTGHFYAGRGMDLLFKLAWANPQVQFLWVGGRPADVTAWRERLQAARVTNVVLTGFVENSRLPLYQAAGDILLMPYERKVATSSGGDTADICSPMKLFEYMAAGRAILSSDLPVLHEVLTPSNAVFCPSDDLLAWQTALCGLLADPSRRVVLGHQARLDVAGYAWEVRARRALEGFLA